MKTPLLMGKCLGVVMACGLSLSSGAQAAGSYQAVTLQGYATARDLRVPARVQVTDQYGQQVQTTTDGDGHYQVKLQGMRPPLLVEVSEHGAECERNDRPRGQCLGALWVGSSLPDTVTVNVNPMTDLMLSEVAEASGFLGPQQLLATTQFPLALSQAAWQSARMRFVHTFQQALSQLGLPEDLSPVTYAASWQPQMATLVDNLWSNRGYDTASGQTSATMLTDVYFEPLAVPNRQGVIEPLDWAQLQQRHQAMKTARQRIFIVGDSTASNYADQVYPRMGWGQVLQAQFVPGQVQVVNGAQSGRSSRAYWAQNWWRFMKTLLRPGDYLLVQMGHNDEKCNGAKAGRGVFDVAHLCTYPNSVDGQVQHPPGQPKMSFQDMLAHYVYEARELGVTPVLLTPITRVQNAEGDLAFPVGGTHVTHQHRDGGYAFVGDYPQTIKQTAERLGVPLLDVEQATIELVNQLGPEGWQDYWLAVDPEVYPYYEGRGGRLDDPDTTHLQARGAQAVAGLVADLLKQSPELSPLAAVLSETRSESETRPDGVSDPVSNN
ncbi:hypothetical protein BFW38_03425 [Terasakiispira papahanaumokuakeensis]|uniref:SGNH hydrolase-type esterase domain-containing protein n=1 Tax=Terasakiispira papahanaumokuakeensis TaxID=197479 RepID=A0A1E2V6X8_9GAMM|nr:rhamnogalacturonan acetylesterase [Terasakiispira papahanaumokuakeensis]ODC02737.1 hypothetical protein BFW38_03425 [Terasakiispira papahanaumokuakeensis]